MIRDGIFTAARFLWAVVPHWVLLGLLVFPYGLGRMIIIGRDRKRGPSAVGWFALFGLVGIGWNKRRMITRGFLVCVVVVCVSLLALALIGRPSLVLNLAVPALFVVAAATIWPPNVLWAGSPGGVVADAVGDGTYSSWLEAISRRARLREAARQGGKVKPIGRTAETDDGWAIDVRSKNGATPDDQAIAAAAAQLGVPVAHVAVKPNKREAARFNVQMLRNPPLAEFERLAEPVDWPGASSNDPLAPYPIGVTADGSTLSLPGPHPNDVRMLGAAGATGMGKSNFLATLLGEMAFRRDTAPVGIDPQAVELGPWEPRLARLYVGLDGADRGLDDVIGRMEARERLMKTHGRRTWSLSFGPVVPVVVDESAALGGDPRLGRIAAQGRKLGFWLIITTQRPDADVWPGMLRDNIGARLAFRVNSPQASRMIFPDQGADPMRIPVGDPRRTQGLCLVQLGVDYHAARTFWLRPKGPVAERGEEIATAAAEIAGQTARAGLTIRWEDFA